MNRTVKIKVNKPCSWVTVLIKEVKHGFVSLFFVKTTGCALVVGKQSGEVFSPFKRRFDHWPGEKLQTDSTFAVNIRNPFYEIPEFFFLQPLQQYNQRLLLVDWPRLKSFSIACCSP